MKTINLRDHYPHYKQDTYIDVPDEVAIVFEEYNLEQEARRKKTARNKAFYSLDYGNGIEKHTLHKGRPLDDLYEEKEDRRRLYKALCNLPDMHFQRLVAHIFLCMSNVDIAEVEGVSEGAVRLSIKRGVDKIKKFIENNY